MAEITKDMTIAQLLTIDRGCAQIFMDAGMHCIGCPSASGESVAQACAVHEIDADELFAKLEDYFKDK